MPSTIRSVGVINKSTATVVLVLIAVACGSPFDTATTVSTKAEESTDANTAASTTFTIAGDSEWQIPPGFSVIPTPATLQDDAMSANDVGPPPDLPNFSMRREIEAGGERGWVLIIVWADGVSAESDPEEVLTSWTEDRIRHADYDAVVVVDRVGLQSATWRGKAQSHGQEPQGIIAAVISHPETQRVWRLSCFVSSEEVSDEVARICDRFQAELRPL